MWVWVVWVGNGQREVLVGLVGCGDDVGRGWRGWLWWGVDDAIVGVADNGGAVVVEAATVGVVGEVVLEELLAGGGVIAFGAVSTFAGGQARVGNAAAEAATEGASVAAFVFDIGVRVDGVFVGRRSGRGGGRVSVAGSVVMAKNRFGGADVDGHRGNGGG